MPSLTISIGSDGPILDVRVGLSTHRISALLAAKQSFSPPLGVRALIDTGASCTCIDPSLVKRFNLTPTGSNLLHSASTGAAPKNANLFDIALFFIKDDGQSHSMGVTLPVLEVDLSSMNTFSVIIGRDILKQTTMIYNGPANSLILNF
jgi:hypothetical protein